MRKIIFTTIFLILCFIHNLYAGNLSQEEINFLLTNCPEMNHMVEKGYVIAYGQIIEAPFLISRNRDMIYIDGIKVSPREEKPIVYQARKKLNEAHEYYFKFKLTNDPNALVLLEQKLKQMKEDGEIDTYSIEQKRYLVLKVTANGQEYDRILDRCPWNISQRIDFILAVVSSKYLLMKDDIGQEKAFEWLKQQFAKLKDIGVLEDYKFIEGIEAANIIYPGPTGGMMWGISDGPLPPKAVEYVKFWKANQGKLENKISDIKSNLKNNKMYIYSFGFEKEVDFSKEALDLIKSIKQKKKMMLESKSLKNQFKLSSQDESALLEELK